MNDSPAVVMIGDFPPPLHGMAAVNAAMLERLKVSSGTVRVIDTGARSLDRAPLARLGRLPVVFDAFRRLMALRSQSAAAYYFSVSGGFGQVYELLFVLLARSRRARIFLHHHSFAYLDERRALTATLVAAAGPAARHIVQCTRMVRHLGAFYGVQGATPLSNVVFLKDVPKPVDLAIAMRGPLRIGFIGNISTEKGIFLFLDLLAQAGECEVEVAGAIAGPFQDRKVECAVRERIGQLRRVRYVGPVHGAKKEEFLSELDVLIFPSRYRNETEGIVNLEALRQGVPVIAYGRGCIPEIISDDCGCLVPPEADFIERAVSALQRWQSSPATYVQCRIGARARFESLGRVYYPKLDELIFEISDMGP